MGVYTKTKDGLKRLDGSDSVQGKLDSHEKNSNIHVTAAEKSRWEKGGDLTKHESNHYIHMQEDDTGELNIVDDNGYVIAKVNAEGLNAKNVKVDGKPVSEMIAEAVEGIEGGGGLTEEEVGAIVDEKLEGFEGGGAGSTTEVTKESLGLGNVDNTSDMEKPVSTPQRTALDNLKKAISEQIDSDSAELYITDKDGNIVATIDADGLHTVEVYLNGRKMSDAMSKEGGTFTGDVTIEGDLNVQNINLSGISIWKLMNNGAEGLEYSTVDSSGREVMGTGEIACVGIGTVLGTDINIATHYSGYVVSQIGVSGDGSSAINFGSNKQITSVNIPLTVEKIDFRAFYGCTNLKEVSISSSGNPILIEGYAFMNCTSLEKIALPDRLKGFGYGAFNGCTALKSIQLPSPTNIKSWDSGVFQASGLTSIDFPDGLKTIPLRTCYQCEDLESVTIPESVTTIEGYAFAECTSLTSFMIPKSVVKFYLSIVSKSTALKEITYTGTIEEWNAVEKEKDSYFVSSENYSVTVHCTDGDVTFDTSEY